MTSFQDKFREAGEQIAAEKRAQQKAQAEERQHREQRSEEARGQFLEHLETALTMDSQGIGVQPQNAEEPSTPVTVLGRSYTTEQAAAFPKPVEPRQDDLAAQFSNYIRSQH